MVVGKEITCDRVADKRGIVTYFYSEETEHFFKDIHKRHGTMQECINDTCASIDDRSTIFAVYWEDELAAYFVRFKNANGQALEGFHVLKPFRHSWFLEPFWEKIIDVFGGSFIIGLYEKNYPAINCVMKAGFTQVSNTIHNNQLFFIFKSPQKP